MGTTIEQLRNTLASHAPKLTAFSPENTRVRAAVAIIGRASRQGDDVEFLYIRRSEFDGDPWSGDIAFPGGRIDGPEELPRRAAERETLEEVGNLLGVTRERVRQVQLAALSRLRDISSREGFMELPFMD